MQAADDLTSAGGIDFWNKAPWVIKLIIAQLQAWLPSRLVTRNTEFREAQPFVHAVFIVVVIALVFASTFYFLHIFLFQHMACYYPIMKVLFYSKPFTPHPSVRKLRGRSHRPSPTSYRGSKFSSARSVGTSAHTQPSAAEIRPSSAERGPSSAEIRPSSAEIRPSSAEIRPTSL